MMLSRTAAKKSLGTELNTEKLWFEKRSIIPIRQYTIDARILYFVFLTHRFFICL